MTDQHVDEVAQLRRDLTEMTAEAERHAYSVRQVAAQRARLMKIYTILGEVATFKDGYNFPSVMAAVQNSGAQFLQDVFALLLNDGKKGGFFVEFGSCDGLLISNTVILEREFGWQGILSEPSRSWHEAITKNRKCIIDFRCVYSESGKTVKFAEFSGDAYGTQSAVLDGDGQADAKVTYDVETISLYDLLREHKAPTTIDFLSIDVEGGEYDILKDFPFNKYRFEFVCVEQMTTEQQRLIGGVFDKAGYKQILNDVSGHDGYYVPKNSKALLAIKPEIIESRAADNAPQSFWESWYEGATFTTDWSSRAFADWDQHLAGLREKQLKVLEVGAWEGRGTIFFLNYFPNSHVTCLDIFTLGNEGLFDANVLAKYDDRVRKIAGRSGISLNNLASEEGAAFDLIYLDGSHDTDDVMMDSLLAFRLLKVGGILIWDDYLLTSAMPGCFNKFQDPKPAIDVFLEWKKSEYEIVNSDYQVIIRKIKPHSEVTSTLFDPEARSTPGL